jgi:hypothetical protein
MTVGDDDALAVELVGGIEGEIAIRGYAEIIARKRGAQV